MRCEDLLSESRISWDIETALVLPEFLVVLSPSFNFVWSFSTFPSQCIKDLLVEGGVPFY
jgi:hypothetical protein